MHHCQLFRLRANLVLLVWYFAGSKNKHFHAIDLLNTGMCLWCTQQTISPLFSIFNPVFNLTATVFWQYWIVFSPFIYIGTKRWSSVSMGKKKLKYRYVKNMTLSQGLSLFILIFMRLYHCLLIEKYRCIIRNFSLLFLNFTWISYIDEMFCISKMTIF